MVPQYGTQTKLQNLDKKKKNRLEEQIKKMREQKKFFGRKNTQGFKRIDQPKK